MKGLWILGCLSSLLIMVCEFCSLSSTLAWLSSLITGIPASWGGKHSQVHSDRGSEESSYKAISS